MQFGDARKSLGGHGWSWVVLGSPQLLPGGCLVVIEHKMKVSESLGKGVFAPLLEEGCLGGSSLLYRGESNPKWC